MTQPNDHIVKSFDDELQRLTKEISRMGRMAVAQLESAMDVIERFDPAAAERIIANDVEIDALEQSIAHDVMRLALRGPLARDLREILVGVRVPAEIERIGDHAANVAKRSRVLAQMPPAAPPKGSCGMPQPAGRRPRASPCIRRKPRGSSACRGADRRYPYTADHRG